MPTVVADPDDVTPAWLTSALQGSGAATGTVTSCSATRIGAGKVGDNVRFELTWDPVGSGPSSVVGKFPSPDPMSRAAGVSLGNYDREVRFYRHLVATLDVAAPRCHAVVDDPATGDFTLLLDDLAPATVGDQIEGCTVEEATAAVEALVGLHAPRHDDPRLADLADWLGPRLVGGGDIIAGIWSGLLPDWLARYGDRLAPDTIEAAHALDAVIGPWCALPDAPVTVTHNDYRLDNLLFGFDATTSRTTAFVVDWQTVGVGPGVADVAYVVGSGLLPDARRTVERQLVDVYVHGMHTRGVALDADETWHLYRRTCPAGLVMSVFASMVVAPGDRSDAMFLAMADRHARQLLDLDALATVSPS